MWEYYLRCPFNYGVGVFEKAVELTERVNQTRDVVANFLGASSNEIVFTKNTTEALNLVAHGLDWRKDDEVIITSIEHQSNYIPWLTLELERGVEVKVVKANDSGLVDPMSVQKAMTDKTRLISLTHVSNVFGTIQNVSQVCNLAQEAGVLCLVDAAQSVGRIDFNVADIGCDFATICGRKALGGPQGTGALFGKRDRLDRLLPLENGSRASNVLSEHEFKTKSPPHRFEAGVINTSGVIGLGRAVQYVEEIGLENIRARIHKLTQYTMDRLRIDNIDIYGPEESNIQAGIMSINVKSMDSNHVANKLYQLGKIAVASGNQGSFMAIKPLGVSGVVRISLHYYNTEKEIDTLVRCLEKIA
jgi:cysteine desulfurase/selenocysteine lyase